MQPRERSVGPAPASFWMLAFADVFGYVGMCLVALEDVFGCPWMLFG